MSDYPKEWEKRVILRNDKQVFLRPELSTDTEMLWKMFSSLSEESLDSTLLSVTRERIEEWTSNINYAKNLPILALTEEEGKQRIIGSASLFFNSAEVLRHKAELRITVHDDYQDLGLGTAMVSHLIEIA